MKNIILNLKNKKAAIVRGIIVIFSFFAMAWGISYLMGFRMIELVYPIAGIALYISFLYFLLEQLKKLEKFFETYYTPDKDINDINTMQDDDINMPGIHDIDMLTFTPMKKPGHKIMFKSMLIFFAVIFLLICFTQSPLIFIALVPTYILTLYCMVRYIKWWKYQGYSVLMLLGMSSGVIAVSIVLAPFVKTGAGIVIAALLAIPKLF